MYSTFGSTPSNLCPVPTARLGPTASRTAFSQQVSCTSLPKDRSSAIIGSKNCAEANGSKRLSCGRFPTPSEGTLGGHATHVLEAVQPPELVFWLQRLVIGHPTGQRRKNCCSTNRRVCLQQQVAHGLASSTSSSSRGLKAWVSLIMCSNSHHHPMQKAARERSRGSKSSCTSYHT